MLDVRFVDREELMLHLLVRPLVFGEEPESSFFEDRILVVLGEMFDAERTVPLFFDLGHDGTLVVAPDRREVDEPILVPIGHTG
jgi:hypothetical protein